MDQQILHAVNGEKSVMTVLKIISVFLENSIPKMLYSHTLMLIILEINLLKYHLGW